MAAGCVPTWSSAACRGLDERGWEGHGLRIGEVVIALADLRGRCVMTTYDPDTLAQDPDVLKSIVRRFDGRLALNAAVVGGRPHRKAMPSELRSRAGGAGRASHAGRQSRLAAG